MASIYQSALDAFLDEIILGAKDEGTDLNTAKLHLLKNEVTSYDDFTNDPSVIVGTADVTNITGPADGTNGARKITVSTAQGLITIANAGTANATHYALVETSDSRLIAVSRISNSASVTDGNNFNLDDFDITINQPS